MIGKTDPTLFGQESPFLPYQGGGYCWCLPSPKEPSRGVCRGPMQAFLPWGSAFGRKRTGKILGLACVTKPENLPSSLTGKSCTNPHLKWRPFNDTPRVTKWASSFHLCILPNKQLHPTFLGGGWLPYRKGITKPREDIFFAISNFFWTSQLITQRSCGLYVIIL